MIKSAAIIPSDYLRSGRSNLTDLRENVLILTFFLIGGSLSQPTVSVYIFISTYIISTGHEKTMGKKTESFHRDRAIAIRSLNTYYYYYYTVCDRNTLYT